MKNFLILLILHLFSLNAFSQEFVATLNQEFDSANLTINDSILATVYQNEKFIIFKPSYEATYWHAWTKDGIFGSINKNSIKILPKEKVFKMTTDTSSLLNTACGVWCTDNFKTLGIDYCNLVKRAAKGNNQAFLEILTHYSNLNGGSAVANKEITWQIFNLWDDKIFNQFLLEQTKNNQVIIAEYLVYYPVSYPITDFEYYYSTYYPLTWQTITGLIDINMKE